MKPKTNADGLEHRLATEWHRQIHHDSRLEADNRRLIAVAASGQDDGRVWKALVEPGREPELALFGYLDVTEDHVCRARHHFRQVPPGDRTAGCRLRDRHAGLGEILGFHSSPSRAPGRGA